MWRDRVSRIPKVKDKSKETDKVDKVKYIYRGF